jgi:Domain of unknown function (DUF4198)
MAAMNHDAGAAKRWWQMAAGLAFFSAGAASAHDFQPDRFWIATNAGTNVTRYVGHGSAREISPMPVARITRFYSIGRAGQHDQRANLRASASIGVSRVRFAVPGLQLLGFETNGTYSDLPGLRFGDYLKDEGLSPALTMRQRLGTTGSPGREIYSRRAKALLQIGPATPGDDAIALRPLGMTLEIVPERNPYAAGFDGQLPVRIYYNGRALPGALVKLHNLDNDNHPMEQHVTDASGRTRFRLSNAGIWQLNVIWTRPIKGDPQAEFETVFSSLALGFTGRPPAKPAN